ncbi:flagellar biosynthesis protein FlgL [Sphingomonas sp. 10B4]|uniref:flagellin N-terminal helical domain-containing protein n=1 Tax=Sphingomonas sp. 10B4 TaxID=3048575 RepID=UPI002AB3BDB1|nr:flagellar biosynthesis protein FlgL [Sphingomonas sp. 10B4]MDY7523596.1 flagellar biosynthesis protein FlgL [Sphingomonas sp. 10B4]MEB0282859.1 flagellar biosynthesis protein FlgL [Sphingomonas sp. 10B4]
MQIGTSQFYDTGASQLSKLSAKADTLNTKIASTKKFTDPSADVVAYNRLSTIKQATADSKAYASNVSMATSLLQQSDSTLSAIGTQLQQAAELTTRAANGTLNDTDRKAIAIQLQSIRDDLVNLAGTKDARGQPLFGAATGTNAVTQAADGTVSFGGTGEVSAIPVADGTNIQATDSAQRVFGNIPTSGGGTTDAFAVLSNFISALNAGGDISSAAGTAADGLKGAMTQVNAVQGSVGARAARLDIVSTQSTDAASARELDRSALEDTDLSSAIAELQKTMTVLSATQASFTKLGSLSLFDYLK